MILNDVLYSPNHFLQDHLGSIWYHSEPSNVPYSPNQFLGLDFCRSKKALVIQDGILPTVKSMKITSHEIVGKQYLKCEIRKVLAPFWSHNCVELVREEMTDPIHFREILKNLQRELEIVKKNIFCSWSLLKTTLLIKNCC